MPLHQHLLAPNAGVPSIVDLARAVGLFGPIPLAKAVAARFAGFLAFADGADVIEHVWPGSVTRALSSVASHSGLAPEEMRVPLLLLE